VRVFSYFWALFGIFRICRLKMAYVARLAF